MKSNDSWEHPAISYARRLLKARKGPPTEADRSQRASKPPRVLDGQIDILGHVHRDKKLDENTDERAA